MDDVLLALVFLSIYERNADVGAGGKHTQGAPLAVVNTGHRLHGVGINQSHISTGIRHPALDLHLLVLRQDVVAERHRQWHERNIGVCRGEMPVNQNQILKL